VHLSLTPPPGDALLFDWDGTLVDSQDANYRAMSHALSIVGIHLEKEWFDSRTGISSVEMIELLARELGVTLLVPVDDLVGRRDARFLKEARHQQFSGERQRSLERGALVAVVARGAKQQVGDGAGRQRSRAASYASPAPGALMISARFSLHERRSPMGIHSSLASRWDPKDGISET
jgi:beta-phosphoglucomutase-like phosphatase (HAD superfamily)